MRVYELFDYCLLFVILYIA